jgi:hypothetical protein
MPKFFDAFRSNLSYAFLVVGIVWLAVAYSSNSYYVLWPALTSLAAGVLLRVYPGDRLTWAWTASTAVLGLLVSGFQAYVASQFLTGSFSSIATASFVGFGAFAAVHLLLLFARGPTSPVS